MSQIRPYVISIAGSDPSGGAGLFADIKTFEAHKVNGLGVVSALTYQNDCTFEKVDWIQVEKILEQVEILLKRFPVKVVKIGLIESLHVLETVVDYIQNHDPEIQLIWDPILKASAGFEFHPELNREMLGKILQNVFLITPNIPEARQLSPFDTADADVSARLLRVFCNVFLKGGHCEEKTGHDTLFLKSGEQYSFKPRGNDISPKHGSGCVLSAALVSNLAQGSTLEWACMNAKQYTAKFLSSNPSLLGYHKV